MKKLFIYCIIVFFSLIPFLLPFHSFADAQPGTTGYHLLVQCGPTGTVTVGQDIKECGFGDLIKQINAIINLLFYASVMLATIAFIYCGFLFLTAGGDAGKAKEAKDIMYKVVIGFIWIFIAWLVVHFITTAFGLKDSGYSILQQQ